MKQKYIIFFLFVILIFIIFKYSFVNLNFFVSKDILKMNNLSIEDKSIKKIIEYSKRKKIKKIELKNNNIHNLNNIIFNWYYKFNLIDLRKNKFYNVKINNFLYWKKIIKKLQKNYWKILIDFPTLHSNFTIKYFNKNLFNILFQKSFNFYNKKELNIEISYDKNNYLDLNNFILFLNDKFFFNKPTKIRFINSLSKKLNWINTKKLINDYKKIDNNYLSLNFFDYINFCNHIECKCIKCFCSVSRKKCDKYLKNKIFIIKENNKKEAYLDFILNKKYLLNGSWAINNNYKKIENQSIILDIFFMLKNRKKVLDDLFLTNNYIKKVFLEEVVFNFPNVKTLNLSWLKSDKIVSLDLSKTKIKNFVLDFNNFIKIKNLNFKTKKNILFIIWSDWKNNKKGKFIIKDLNKIFLNDYFVIDKLIDDKKNFIEKEEWYYKFNKNLLKSFNRSNIKLQKEFLLYKKYLWIYKENFQDVEDIKNLKFDYIFKKWSVIFFIKIKEKNDIF